MSKDADEIEEFLLNLDNDNNDDNYKLTSYPTAMSCTQAFNELYSCYSIGGQFRNVYRYGEMNNCLNQRQKFKFCMFTKLSSKQQQEIKIAGFYKQQLAQKKMNGSSEDIWTIRKNTLSNPFSEEQE
jgi:hypothetical protein